MSSIIKQLPTVALRGLTILPGMVAHFDVSREKSIKAVEEAMMDEQEIFLLTQKNPEEEEPTAENLYSIGLVAEIKQVIKMPNDLVRVLVEGIERAELNCFTETEEYLLAEVIRFTEDGLEDIPENAREAMIRCLEEKYEQFCTYNSKNGKEAAKPIQEIHELDRLIDTIANSIPIGYEEKQRILEAVTITERYEVLMAIL